jgi:hypothetical protein
MRRWFFHLLAEARFQGGLPLCSVLWRGDRTSPAYAALINGAAADFSDVHLAMQADHNGVREMASLRELEAGRHKCASLRLLAAVTGA